MGYYLHDNDVPEKNKEAFLGRVGTLVPNDLKWNDVPSDQTVIRWADKGLRTVALFAHDEREIVHTTCAASRTDVKTYLVPINILIPLVTNEISQLLPHP